MVIGTFAASQVRKAEKVLGNTSKRLRAEVKGMTPDLFPGSVCYETKSGRRIPPPDTYDLERGAVDGSRARCLLRSCTVPPLDRVPDLQHAHRVAPSERRPDRFRWHS